MTAAPHRSILIAGASVRAAAHSALAAGMTVEAVDLFADRDLSSRSATHRIVDYPREILSVAASLPRMDWMYTGGLENHPGLVAQISARHRLLGCTFEALRKVRDPLWLAEVLARADLPVPRVRRSPEGLPRDGSWLVKRRGGSGGGHVARWGASDESNGLGSDAAPRRANQHDWYFQEWRPGLPAAAIFCATQSGTELWGLTEQLIGPAWLGARGFQYAGSLGPLALESALSKQLQRLGDTVACAAGLLGIFGIDGLLECDTFWPVEVNPRYTASVELLERAGRFSAIGRHSAACRGEPLGELPPISTSRWHGKAIVMARTAHTLSARQSDRWFSEERRTRPDGRGTRSVGRETVRRARPEGRGTPLSGAGLADLPAAGSSLAPGLPVLTVLAQTSDRASLVEQLHVEAEMVYRELIADAATAAP